MAMPRLPCAVEILELQRTYAAECRVLEGASFNETIFSWRPLIVAEENNPPCNSARRCLAGRHS